MDNYFRITGYRPKENICFILDCNGKFQALWEFSSYLVSKGVEIIAVGRDDRMSYGNFPRAEYDTEHLFLRACAQGKPEITGKIITVHGKCYTAR